MSEHFTCNAGAKVPYGGACPKCGAGAMDACGGVIPMLEAQLAQAEAAQAVMVGALEKAERFIINGVETGYVRLPTMPSDLALETLPAIQAALAHTTEGARRLLDVVEAASEAFYKAWPGFQVWWAASGLPIHAMPPEPFEAAIAAYLAALPKGELAERLDQFAENANCPLAHEEGR